MGLNKILDRLLKNGLLSKERSEESDYDLIYTISKLREKKKKRDEEIKEQKSKDSEIDAFLDILENNRDSFTESEINYLYKDIFNLDDHAY